MIGGRSERSHIITWTARGGANTGAAQNPAAALSPRVHAGRLAATWAVVGFYLQSVGHCRILAAIVSGSGGPQPLSPCTHLMPYPSSGRPAPPASGAASGRASAQVARRPGDPYARSHSRPPAKPVVQGGRRHPSSPGVCVVARASSSKPPTGLLVRFTLVCTSHHCIFARCGASALRHISQVGSWRDDVT